MFFDEATSNVLISFSHLQYILLFIAYYYCNLHHDGNSQRNCESEQLNMA